MTGTSGVLSRAGVSAPADNRAADTMLEVDVPKALCTSTLTEYAASGTGHALHGDRFSEGGRRA
jgi:hypothetical protein